MPSSADTTTQVTSDWWPVKVALGVGSSMPGDSENEVCTEKGWVHLFRQSTCDSQPAQRPSRHSDTSQSAYNRAHRVSSRLCVTSNNSCRDLFAHSVLLSVINPQAAAVLPSQNY